jgi:hypothetical protein
VFIAFPAFFFREIFTASIILPAKHGEALPPRLFGKRYFLTIKSLRASQIFEAQFYKMHIEHMTGL